MYERAVSKHVGVELYAAPSGEPALGPVAFMHRPSAMDNPLAPIGHHWQDATHISFGVLTAGIFTHTWKLEGSAFNGREPDDSRWNFDPIRLDSYSGRFTVNPTERWSLEAGYGYLKSPEALTPDGIRAPRHRLRDLRKATRLRRTMGDDAAVRRELELVSRQPVEQRAARVGGNSRSLEHGVRAGRVRPQKRGGSQSSTIRTSTFTATEFNVGHYRSDTSAS